MGIIVKKGEIACKKQFLLFSQCFLPYVVLIFHFKCTLKCRLQFVSILTSLKFCRLVMGESKTNTAQYSTILSQIMAISEELRMLQGLTNKYSRFLALLKRQHTAELRNPVSAIHFSIYEELKK